MLLRNRIIGFYILFVVLGIQHVVCQQDKALFLMHDLPQANIVNPAVGIKCTYYIGIPLLSSMHYNYSNTLTTANEIFTSKTGSDSLKYNLQSIVNQTHNTDLISLEAQITLIDFGYHWNNNYITFAIRENINEFTTIPQDAIKLAYYGNTHFLGETANLSGARAIANHYREYDFGFSTDVNDKWRLGGRVKLLFGKSNVSTSKYFGELYTNSNTFGISADANYRINVSAPVDVTLKPDGSLDNISVQKNLNALKYAFNRQNIGLAADLGAIYHLNEEVTISASLLDFGAILWRSDVHNLATSGTFSYQGEVNGASSNTTIRDSITNSYKIDVNESSYFSNLVPRLYLGGTYQFASHLNSGATFYSEILKNKIHPAFGLSLNTVGFKIFSGSLMWSAQNSTYFNIGVGLGARFGVAQFHLTSDNVPAFFALDHTRNINLRFGVNLLFGCNKKKAKKLPPLPAIACPTKKSDHKPKHHNTGYEPSNKSNPPKSNLKYQTISILH